MPIPMPLRKKNAIASLGGALVLASLVASGCGTSSASSDDLATSGGADLTVRPTADMAAPPDLQPPGPDFGCYPTPATYLELLNGCTTAQAIDKTPVTPLLNKDGTLPPLP